MGVANSPHPNTVTVSFTMPREMTEAVNRRAKAELTNKSDIIRRALLAYLPPEEAQEILRSVMNEETGGCPRPMPPQKPVIYEKGSRKKTTEERR
jgi:Arc/MetJ-type ribon-helix-helix transcriptional regulator